jgi:hypothetical protein
MKALLGGSAIANQASCGIASLHQTTGFTQGYIAERACRVDRE